MISRNTSDDRETIETDVLIIGAGIAGSALASALRDSGLTVVLIDKSDQPLDTARGDHLQPGTCDILERWGVLDKLFVAGAEKRAGTIWYSGQGDEILRSTVSGLAIPHPYFAFINHEKIASVLLDAALQSENVRCLRPIRNWWPEDSSSSGQNIKVGLPGGSEAVIRSKVLVGADGRQSRVRQTFGFESVSHRYKRSIAVFFARLTEDDPDRFLKVYLGDGVTTSVIPRTGGNCKIGIPVSVDEARLWRGLAADELTGRLRRVCPSLAIDAAKFADSYPPIYLRADSWVRDAAVLVGDACHAMHPARSQGMNIAIRCIDVLAELLGNAGSPLADGNAVDALQAYERKMKGPIDAVLHDNHQWGQRMDESNPDTNRALQTRLETVQADAALLRAYSLRSAGYAET